MKSQFLPRVCFVFLLSLISQLSFAQQFIKANIGKEEILLPTIENYSDPSVLLPQMKTLGETMTPASNRLLAILINDDNIADGISGKAPKLERYFMIQTLRSHENDTLTPEIFAEILGMIKNNYQSIFAKASGKIQNELDIASKKFGAQAGGKEMSLKMGELKLIEIFDEKIDSISALAMTKMSVAFEGTTKEIPVALSISTNKIKGKVVYFAAYSIYKDEQDFAWIKQKTSDWVTQAITANSPITSNNDLEKNR